jgi:hypothetical protein
LKRWSQAVGNQSRGGPSSQTVLRNLIDQVTIGRTAIQVQLSEGAERAEEAGSRSVMLPWTPPSPYRKREIIQGVSEGKTSARPMRAKARVILIDALRDAHRWLEELLSDPRQTLESLASQEGKTNRSIRMTLSLAFLAPNIVKAAIEGRLPRGCGLKRLVDLRWLGPTDGGRWGSRHRPAHKNQSGLRRLCSNQCFATTGHSPSAGANSPPIATLETKICGQRLWPRCAGNSRLFAPN